MSVSAQADVDAGINAHHAAYGDGEEYMTFSMEKIAQSAREGYDTFVMKSFAGNVLRQAGFPKSEFAQMSAILDFVRRNVGYRADAPMREQIQSAAVSLCVDGAPVCIPIGDCDDLVTCVATLLMAAGFHVRIVKQLFAPVNGKPQQQHVIVEAYDTQREAWVSLDPSSDMPAGQKASAIDETRINPLENMPQKFVGVGALPVIRKDANGWHRLAPTTGVGAPMTTPRSGGLPGLHYTPTATPTGIGAPPIPFVEVTGGHAHAGLRYRIGVQITMPYDPSDTIRVRNDLMATFKDFTVESATAVDVARQLPDDGDFYQSWIVQGIAKVDTTIENTSLVNASTVEHFVKKWTVGDVKILIVGVQASGTGPAPAPAPNPLPPPPLKTDTNDSGILGPVLIAGTLALGGGFTWHAYKQGWIGFHKKRAA